MKFHINGPFASTVARDSIRDCRDNRKLIKEIARIVSDSMLDIKKRGLMSYDFLSVLPNSEDNIQEFYNIITESVLHTFKIKPLLLTVDNKYVKSCDGLTGAYRMQS